MEISNVNYLNPLWSGGKGEGYSIFLTAPVRLYGTRSGHTAFCAS